MDLSVAPLDDGTWEQFCMFYWSRGIPLPPRPPQGIWLHGVRDFGHLVSGCCIYPCEGPFAWIEYFAVNPEAPRRHRVQACRATASLLRAYCVTSGKMGLVAPRNGMPTLRRALAREGFVDAPATLMLGSPSAQL